jgi:gamma-glutamylputrescine oxidase
MLSFWEYESFFKDIDIAIIGSGIVGLSAAISLKERDPACRIAIIERSFLPYGASTRNAGFACFGSLTELLDDLNHSSEDEVLALVERRYRGLLRLRERVGDAAMQYEQLGGIEIFRAEESAIAKKCFDAMPHFNEKIGAMLGKKEIYQRLEDPQRFGFQGINDMIINTAEGQIHTGEMMRSLLGIAQSKGIFFLNGLNIEHLKDENNRVVLQSAQGWEFSCLKVLICTNGFAKRLLPTLEVNPARNQVMVTSKIPNLKVKGAFHYDKGYFYFRNIEDRILIGGGRNLAFDEENTDQFGTTPQIQNAIRGLLNDVILPNQPYQIEHVWSGIMGLGDVKKPILTMHSPNVGVAVRMGGMGVAIGSLVGDEGAKMLLD